MISPSQPLDAEGLAGPLRVTEGELLDLPCSTRQTEEVVLNIVGMVLSTMGLGKVEVRRDCR
jgi:hypothetical protein